MKRLFASMSPRWQRLFKFAACAALIVTTHVPVPLHPAPLQPLNTEPADGLAVRVTIVPLT